MNELYDREPCDVTERFQPTAEFRQVKREIRRGNGVLGPGYREEITGYDVTVQQKWVRTVYTHVGSARYPVSIEERSQWRELPTAWEKKL